MMKRLLIVGGGMTGASLSYLLSKAVNPSLVELVVWDKARGLGGRMNTSRSDRVPGCRTDLGAQYFSVTPEEAEQHQDVYRLLTEEQVLRPLAARVENAREYPPGTKHWISPPGCSSLPKTLLRVSGAKVELQRHVVGVDLSADSQRWTVRSRDGPAMEVDSLVLTLPVPQLLQLEGNFLQSLDHETMGKLRAVQYSTRFALGLFFRPGTKLPGDWAAMYVNDSPCLRFLSKDHEKRGCVDEAVAITAHTSVPFGLKQLQKQRAAVERMILEEVQRVLPSLPPPEDTKLILWRYSQVHKEFSGRPGALLVHSRPTLVLAGDGFSHSNINGALMSATTAAAHLQPAL